MTFALVIFGDLQRRSGGYLYDRMLVEELERHGHRVCVIGQRDASYLLQPVLSRLRALLRGNPAAGGPCRPDVAIVDELNHAAAMPLIRRWNKRGCPVVGLVHHLRADEVCGRHRHRALRREASFLRRCDAFLVNSETTRRRVLEAGGDETQPYFVAYPGGDRLAAYATERDGGDEPLRRRGVLFVGNVIPRKNVHVIVRALAKLEPETLRRIEPVVVAGSLSSAPRYVRYLRNLVDRLGLEDSVHLSGRIDERTLAREVRKRLALVVPSQYEGFGIVYLEAMRAGAIPVAGHLGGGAEILRDGIDGFLVPPGDADALALTLRRIATLEDDELRAWQERARRRAESFPTWRQSMASAREFLETLR